MVTKKKLDYPIKISVVEPSGQLYGSELALLEVLEGLDQRKFIVEVILPKNAPLSKRLQELGISVKELLQGEPQLTTKLHKSISYLQVALHWLRHRPHLILVSQGGILRPISILARFFKLPIACWLQTMADAQWVSRFRYLHGQVVAFICNSEFTASVTNVPAEKKSILYLGYRPKGFIPIFRNDSLRREKKFRIGLIGRLAKGKGHELVLEVADYLLKNSGNEEIPFTFVFIGNAIDSSYQQQLQQQVVAKKLEKHFVFRGYMANIGQEFANLEALIIPSIVPETFGRTLCEAAEARLPVLLADAGGPGELSHRFVVGERFAVNNVESFGQGLLKIREEYEVVVSHFEQGANRLLTALNYQAYLKHFEEILTLAACGQTSSVTWLGEPN